MDSFEWSLIAGLAFIAMFMALLVFVMSIDAFVFNPQIKGFCRQQGYQQTTYLNTRQYCMNNEKGIMHYVRGNCNIATLKCNPVLYREIVEPYKEAK